jgi:nucleoside-diphosphate-sugar epimerase
MRLLLIGNGYLGKAIVAAFRHAGWEVTAASLTGADGSIACDVADPGAVSRLPAADQVIHCAATGRGGAEAYQRVHVLGCRHLTERFPGVPVCFTSSTSVYSQADGSVVTEQSAAIPERETGKLLLEAERIVLEAGGLVGRLSGIYGPARSVILEKFLRGESVIEEDGRRLLNQIHRDDAARAILHLVSLHATGIYNICDSTPLTQLECHQALSRIFSLPMPPSGPRDLNRKRGWTHKRVSNAKLRATGWEPRYPSFLDAVKELGYGMPPGMEARG